MQFIYHANASQPLISLDKTSCHHIFTVRRHPKKKPLYLRNFADDRLYCYTVEDIKRHSASLVLHSSQLLPKKPERFLHIGWSLIDLKSVEKTLPTLNEMGVGRLSLIYAQRTQRDILPASKCDSFVKSIAKDFDPFVRTVWQK